MSPHRSAISTACHSLHYLGGRGFVCVCVFLKSIRINLSAQLLDCLPPDCVCVCVCLCVLPPCCPALGAHFGPCGWVPVLPVWVWVSGTTVWVSLGPKKTGRVVILGLKLRFFYFQKMQIDQIQCETTYTVLLSVKVVILERDRNHCEEQQ